MLAFSAMMQPGRTKATAAARATGQQRPRTNRAQTADGRTAPPDQEGTTAGSPGQDPPRPHGRKARQEARPTPGPAATDGDSTPQNCRRPKREVIHSPRAPKLSTDPAPWMDPKRQARSPQTRQNPRISPQKPPNPVSIFSIFCLDSRFFLDFLPSPSRRRLDFSPFSLPIRRKFLDFSAPILDFLHFSHRPGVPKFLQFSPISQLLPIFLDFSRPVRLAIFSILCYNIFQQILVVSAQIPQTPDMVTMHKFFSVVLAVL